MTNLTNEKGEFAYMNNDPARLCVVVLLDVTSFQRHGGWRWSMEKNKKLFGWPIPGFKGMK